MTAAPIRTCVGCGAKRSPADLIRFRLGADDSLVLDRHGPGRGAWLCRSTASVCFDRATRRRAWARTLRRSPDGESVELTRRLVDGGISPPDR